MAGTITASKSKRLYQLTISSTHQYRPGGGVGGGDRWRWMMMVLAAVCIAQMAHSHVRLLQTSSQQRHDGGMLSSWQWPPQQQNVPSSAQDAAQQSIRAALSTSSSFSVLSVPRVDDFAAPGGLGDDRLNNNTDNGSNTNNNNNISSHLDIHSDTSSSNAIRGSKRSKLKLERIRRQAAMRSERLQLRNNITFSDLVQVDEATGEATRIVGNVSGWLDFAMIGFGKCGTSSIMHWLAMHPEIASFRDEVNALMLNRPHVMMHMLYHLLPPGPFKRGYKNPSDITQVHIMDLFRQYWPRTRLIIGVRHPVLWFESLYNFRVQNLLPGETSMPHPNRLIGRCYKGYRNTCTEKGNFAYSLIRLGKGNHPSPRLPTATEQDIVHHIRRTRYNVSAVPYVPNPIFFFEVNQLADTDADRRDWFRRDVSAFLGLNRTLSDPPHYRPGREWDRDTQQRRDAMKMDICQAEYRSVRQELMRLARLNSVWMRETFLHGPDVHVSSRDYLMELLERWMHDPCDDTSPTSALIMTNNSNANTHSSAVGYVLHDRVSMT